MTSVLEKLEQINDKQVRSWFGQAGLASYMEGIAANQHNSRRMDAQVDAMLACKYGDKYKPPETPEEGEMAGRMQFGNNIILSEKNQAAIREILGVEPGEGEAQPPPGPAGPRLGWLLPLLMGLVAVLLGVLIALQLMPDQPLSDVFVPLEIDKPR